MLLIGLITLINSLNYKIGTLSRMGPGYFPLLLAVMLIIVSVIIMLTPTHETEQGKAKSQKILYRPWFCVVLSVVLFITLGRYGGFVPATFAIVFVSALGDDDNSLVTAMGLGAVITIFA